MNSAARAHLYNLAKTIGKPIGVYPFPKTYRRHLLDVLEQLRISCVIDVGAHTGGWATILRGIGYKGTILSFEPVSASFEQLAELARNDEKWKVFPFALGEQDSTASIHLYKASDFNSLLDAQAFARQRFSHELVEFGTEQVQIRRLDTLFTDLHLSDQEVYLKIDTQGYDKKVVAGALGILDRVIAMQSELPGARPIYRGQPNMIESLGFYRSLGYFPTGFFPIVHGYDGLAVIEFDVVFTRQKDQLDSDQWKATDSAA